MIVPVLDFKKVDVTRYKEGTIFSSDNQLAVLQNGKMDKLIKQSDLKGYVKKTDIKKLIAAQLKEVEK